MVFTKPSNKHLGISLFAMSLLFLTGCAHNDELAYNERERPLICSYTSEQVFTCQSRRDWLDEGITPDFEFEQQRLPIHQRVEVIEDELEELESRK